MTRNFAGIAGLVIVLAVVFAYSACFTVHQTEQALVLQFGEPLRVDHEPGLKFKLPFIQNVVYFDRRVLDFDPPAEEVIAADKKRLVVDAYTRFRITDPLRFYQTVGSEHGVRDRLSAIENGVVRRVIGTVTLASILSAERAKIMEDISNQVNAEAKEFGIDIIDVRIRHADLPEANNQAIYARMQSERQREAKEYRAQGAESAQRIRAKADKDKVVILADTQRQSQITRGEGDSESVRIYADAYNKDPDFFAFYRTMQAYRNALANSDTTLVLTPDSDFLRFFNDISGKAGAAK
jgi:membrane protease subunit HflC